jgi:hypothetical protein
MHFGYRLALAVAVAAFSWQAPARAAEDVPAETIARLIADLGSNEFSIRESATEQLALAGPAALAALQATANHPDREVRYRAQRVLGLIRQYDVERRLEAFLSGKDTPDYPLPGWSRFKKSYGDGPEHRKLFVEMQRLEGELLRALEENPRRAADLLNSRMTQVHQAVMQQPQPLSVGQVSAQLFVAAEVDAVPPTQTLSVLFNQCFQPTMRNTIMSGGRGELPRKMLASIVQRSDGFAAFQALSVAIQFKMPEGIAPATKILKTNDGPPMAPLVQQALVAVAKLGDASHLPLVDTPRLLHDRTQVAQFRENEVIYTIQLRDVALATALVLAQQDLRAFFDIPRNQPFDDPQMIFLNPRLIGFSSEEKRREVFAKWEKFKAGRAAAPNAGN